MSVFSMTRAWLPGTGRKVLSRWFFFCLVLNVASTAILLASVSGVTGVVQENYAPSGKSAYQRKLLRQSNKGRVAVLVAGSLNRYLLNSSVHHLISPMVEQNYYVDYFLFLTSAKFAAYRSETSYMRYLTWDPVFDPVMLDDGYRQEGKVDESKITAVVRNSIEGVGGNLAEVRIQESIDLDSNPQMQKKRAEALKAHPEEDPDLRFPMIDLRPKAMERTANGNRNMLRLFLGLETLYNQLVAMEQKEGKPYDYVMILRDDTYWLKDFDMDKLKAKGPAEAYFLSCDARDPPMVPQEINDHSIILSRKKAHVFGAYFSTLFGVDYEACGAALDESIRKGGIRGCNSEMIMKRAVQENQVDVKLVGQGIVPFQRAMTLRTESGVNGGLMTCYHKFCQSHEDPLEAGGDLQTCKSLKFDK